MARYHSQKLHARARSLYIYQGKSLARISEELHINRQTLSRWKEQAREEGDDWHRARAAASLAGEGAEAVALKFLEDFIFLLDTTMADVKSRHVDLKPQERIDALARLADAYTKATRAVERSLPKVSELAVAMEVLQLQAKFIAERFPKHGKAFSEVLEPFGAHLAKRYG